MLLKIKFLNLISNKLLNLLMWEYLANINNMVDLEVVALMHHEMLVADL